MISAAHCTGSLFWMDTMTLLYRWGTTTSLKGTKNDTSTATSTSSQCCRTYWARMDPTTDIVFPFSRIPIAIKQNKTIMHGTE